MTALMVFVRRTNAGHVFGANAPYRCFGRADTVRRPGFTFVRCGRLPGERIPAGVLEVPADLLIRVEYPTEPPGEADAVAAFCLRHGFGEAWVIRPARHSVCVFPRDEPAVELGVGAALTGVGPLAGFACAVESCFAIDPRRDGSEHRAPPPVNRPIYPIQWSPGEQRLFDEADSFPPDELVRRAVDRIAVFHRASGYDDFMGERCVPDGGAGEEEIVALEQRLGVSLPLQYRAFLLKWRSLIIVDGFDVWGPPRPGWDGPHVANPGLPGVGPLLLCGRYHREEDGDSLAIDIGHPDAPAWISMHSEDRPFAPSFAHALWRITEMVVPAGNLQNAIERTRWEVEQHKLRVAKANRRRWKFW